jgi:transmembrane sensor
MDPFIVSYRCMPLSRLWELLARKYNNGISDLEQEELDHLLLTHRDALELNEILTRSGDLDVKKVTTALDEARSREWIARKMEEREATRVQAEPDIVPPDPPDPSDHPGPPEKPLYQRLGFIWLAIFLAILGANAWLFFPAPKLPPPPTKEVTTSYSKTRVTLPDGTSVVLDRNSTIDYNKDFGVGNRVISLMGEAHFEVARNIKTPLVVKAAPVIITVLGSSFDVRAYTLDSTIEISLSQGSLRVSSSHDTTVSILLRYPGERVFFRRAGSLLRLDSVKVKP